MRAYAATALEEEGATTALRDRHVRYFNGLTQALGPKFYTRELAVAVAALEPDMDNLRAAIDWGLESDQTDLAADLVAPTNRFFFVLGLWPENWARCKRLLAAELGPLQRANLLYSAGASARNSDPSASLRLATEGVELGRSLGYDRVVADGLYQVANVQAWMQPDEALRTADEAIDLARKAGFHHLVGLGLHNKAWACFWLGRAEEAFSLAEEAVRALRDVDYLWGVVAARTISSIAPTHSGRLGKGLEEAEILLELSTELSALTFVCWGERHRAEAYMYLGDAGAAGALARARAVAESIDDLFNLACAETGQGHLEVSLGHDDEGYELLQAGSSQLEALGLGRMCVNNRAVLAEVALRGGDLGSARGHLDTSTWRLPRRPDPEGVPVLRAEARLARAEGDWRRAHGLACDGLEEAASAGHLVWAIDLLELVAIASADLGHHAEAVRLLGAAESQREATGYRRWAPARDELAPVLVAMQTALGQEGSEQAILEGRGLSLEDAVAYARRGRGSHSRPVSGWDSLTPTERRVVALVAKHLTNAEIADQLFVSTLTVKSHLTRVFAKLGVADRHQLAEMSAVHITAGQT
jgi:DNA-binding CsgD family transcriptional regulator